MADPTITGTGAVKRAEFKLFADVGEAESPEWELQGDRIEELSLELNPNVETVTDVTGVTATTLDKYEEQTSVEPYYAKRESKLFAWLYSVVRDKKTLTDVEKTFCCVNIFAESEGKYDAWTQKGYCSRPVLRRQHQGATASIQHPLDWGAHLWRCGHHGRQAHLYPWIVCVGGITYGQPEHRREGGASVYRQRRESSH